MNPLDTDETFTFSGRNPNVSLRKATSGPLWRVSFEVEESVALDFAHTETAGMNLDFAAQVTDRNQPKPDKPKGGAISRNAGMLSQEPEANNFAVAQNFDDMKSMIYKVCKVTSRAQLDHSEEAAKAYETLKHRYYRWQGEMGT